VRSPIGRPAPAPFLAGDRSGQRSAEFLGLNPLLPANALPIGSQFGQTNGPSASPAQLYELGLTTAAMAYHTAAIEALRDCVSVAPDHALAWRKLAELLRLAKEDAEAQKADFKADRSLPSANKWKKASGEREPLKLKKAEERLLASLKSKTADEATQTLREHLIGNPRDVVAMRLLAGFEMLAGDGITCMRLLERALDLSPNYVDAREEYASVLMDRRDFGNAVPQIKRLLAHAPRNPHYRTMHAHAITYVGDFHGALELLVGLLREKPGESRLWLVYAQCLRFVGRRDECVQALRRCLALDPGMGEAYWGLSELKGKFISEDDIVAMREQLAGEKLEQNSRAHMLYALAHSLERAGDFSASFAAYEEGARHFRIMIKERAAAHRSGQETDEESAGRVRRMKEVYSRRNLQTRLVQAPAAPARGTPIFVVGMPRAGSTLVEQILSSHSLVEGTRELPLIGDITRELALSRMLVVPDAYPECILDFTPDQLAELGGRCLERSFDYRKTDRPYFVDKRPWNWLEVGLIHLILPHAKIIDVRREPMAACFAMFKQLLPMDAAFSYDFDDLGRYYNKYIGMMDHWEAVLPGRVHFLQYERLVEDTETEIRRLLEYCGLPFEENCLRFWETDRAVFTPSAEQVRRPIFRDALEQWRKFEPWLGPLKEALSRPAEA
jgi:tetratricopeptide (TPR) repeat protein